MIEGKVVIITGGAGTLGRLFSRSVVQHKGVAVIADLDLDRAQHLADELSRVPGACVVALPLDITSEASVEALIATTVARCGRIDAVVNNAYPRNPAYGRRLEDVTYADFCDNVSTHLGGYFLVAKQFAMFFRTQGAGNIINMASIYGVMAPRFEIYGGTAMTMPVEYAAIKSAVIHLTRYFAQYFKGSGLRVNSISPGGILGNQPQQFLDKYNAHGSSKGMLDAEDVCGTLLFLLSDASALINGQNLVVDDGFTL